MKKIIAMTLIVLVLFSFAACKSAKNGSGKNDADLIKELQECYLGVTVEMGEYEQSNDRKDGLEPIKWTVIAKEENRVLLWCNDILDYKPFDETIKEGGTTWETSDLRKFLNGSFYETTFNDYIKSRIISSTIITRNWTRQENFITTNDKIFVLSEEEQKNYNLYNRPIFTASPTAYARGQGADGHYWGRETTNVDAYHEARYCIPYGGDDYDPSLDSFGVRPALWINIE